MAGMEWLGEAEERIKKHDRQGSMSRADGIAHDFLHDFGDKLIAAVKLAEKRAEQLRPLLVGPEGLLFISNGDAHRAVRKLAQDCVLDILGRLHSGVFELKETPEPKRPVVVCLCGSTRFKRQFVEATFRETLAGKIVLTIGCDLRTDKELFGHLPADEFARIKARLDELHLRKIDLAGEVLIVNVGGYIGESTSNELAYAQKQGKRIRFLEQPPPEKGKP